MNKDTIAGLLLLALAGAYFLATRTIPDSSLSDAVGATGLPYVLAAALVILAAMLTVKGLLAARAMATPLPAEEEAEERAKPLRALGFVGIGIGYMIVAPAVGYAIGLALLIVAVALYERERLSLRLVGVAAVGGISFWLIFVKLLGTEQPVSWLLG